jgi:hypothetical protein
MTADLYHSDKPVPDRVDRAWKRGYDEGRKHWQTIAIVALGADLLTLARGRRTPVAIKIGIFYVVLIGALCAMVLAPIAAVVVASIWTVRRWRSHRASRPVVGYGSEPF